MVVVAAVIRIEIISLIFPVIRGITPARDSRSQHLTFLVVAALFFFLPFSFFLRDRPSERISSERKQNCRRKLSRLFDDEKNRNSSYLDRLLLSTDINQIFTLELSPPFVIRLTEKLG